MIKQGRLSKGVSGFKFLEKYGLSEYKNPREPVVFFGCYYKKSRTSWIVKYPEDFNAVINHKALGIIIWLGSDIELIDSNALKKIKGKANIKHIAENEFIANDLRKAGIKFNKIPIYSGQNITNPQPLGDCIYCYVPKHRYNYYGGQIINELKKLLPNEKFIITSSRQYPKRKIMEFYKQSFIGLRLTKHDGIPHTVVEMGLMGRRCIFNNNLPNSIPWKTIQDIIKTIKIEKKMIGQTNIQIANAMANYFNIGNSWLNENYWK